MNQSALIPSTVTRFAEHRSIPCKAKLPLWRPGERDRALALARMKQRLN